jgi:hypothetical protein
MDDIPFQLSMYHASADFASRRMTHRPLAEQVLWQARAPMLAHQFAPAPVGVGGYGFWGPRACPWGSISVIITPPSFFN